MTALTDNTSWESLRSQHTTSSPNTTPREAITVLRAFKKQTEGLGIMETKERIRSTPGVQDAMIAFLIYGFTPIGGLPQDQETGDCLDVALDQILPHMDLQFKQQFLKQVVFNVSFHGFHQLLSPAAAKALDFTTLETSLLEHARSDNDLHLNNAVHFASLLPAKLSNNTQDELWMIIKTRIKNPRLHKIVRETLEEMIED